MNDSNGPFVGFSVSFLVCFDPRQNHFNISVFASVQSAK